MRWTMAAAAAGTAAVAATAWRALPRPADLTGHTALVTGGSRGLGLLIARELGTAGCRVLVCARSGDELDTAVDDLRGRGIDAHGLACDLRVEREIAALTARVSGEFGPLDILVNNAGIIRVGPAATMSDEDVAEALDLMFWAPYRLTRAFLPELRERSGRVVTVTSIGAKVSVPHLLPYSVGKFAEAAFAEGMDAETAGDVRFTTVVPGLMRTGSHMGAEFTGRPGAEYAWFALLSGLPVLSMDAERAARAIVRGMRQGRRYIVLTPAARVAMAAKGVAPGLVQTALRATGAVLPGGPEGRLETGEQARERTGPVLRLLTRLNDTASRRFNQVPRPRPEAEMPRPEAR
ncbi:SDR family NAD(P)-dependent oxidoreductase [Streptomonospora nanhaiensis]|uniref:NAD(P)-dependent dehydrogenase (Short-subunit alcohol dehydrogenase family) n=1 Tax=Streptomonospora nanhaiensis TaxID=1323731 RepID=A0A853BJU9_9ACTN|nr:SDR family NAD(P)-dependent oxidoreductase [Streptomonospora nanhaiensis]MBV2362944.1 SDR family NAD(P)-dependent oxidoreductase [Streptomonospora nanhaiensis]MBX9388949.1 SDR family NAD(P)-dependent oxidoreductase [Streptomonospora nanhaiensis]NYI95310.1 NAD(P)-dependent dehydrogenase (short-subunit alcohol dehydrogenase family) [Streptomonospora nanhaiensis]